MSAPERSTGRIAVHLNCPHCHSPIELGGSALADEILCPSCGSSFRVDADRTQSWTKDKLPQLDRFELIEAVGRGAFGTVYRARDLQLERTVAVKVPRSGHLATQEDEDRFVREARNAAQLQHPGIVPVYEVGRGATFPYIVCEFIEGATLADALTARKFGFRESAKLVSRVAEALQHAHEQGVVHRDLKPSNIMLTADGTPRVMDFGLAKRDVGDVTVTVEGQVLGTPAYMSPEQASGQAHHVDGRSDVYSLGTILYELATGELPFRGNQRMLLNQVLHDEPRSLRSLNDRIPRDLETICLKAMAKEPGRRYQTAQALADDLGRYLAHEPIAARPVGRVERGWRWCRRNPLVAGLSAAVAVALLAGSIVSGYFAIEANRRAAEALAEKSRADEKATEANSQRIRADQKAAEALANAERAAEATAKATEEAQRATLQAQKATRVAQFLAGMFEASAPLKHAGFRFTGFGRKNPGDAQDPKILAARALLDEGARKVVDELKDQPDVQAALMDTIGNVYVGLGFTDHAEPLLTGALAIRRKLYPQPHLDTAASLYSLAVLRSMQFLLGESANAARECVELRQQLLGGDHPDTIDAKFMLAFSKAWGDYTHEPEQLLREVVTWRQNNLGQDHSDTAFATIALAGVLLHRGMIDEAAPLLVAATDAFKKNPATRPIGLAMAEAQQARLLWGLRQYQAAAALTTKAVERFREFEGDDHPLFIFVLSLHLASLKRVDRVDEAKQFYRDQIDRIHARGRELDTGIIDLIATFLVGDGTPQSLAEAEQFCRDERRRARESGKPATSADAELAFTLARVLEAKARATNDEKLADEAIELFREGMTTRRNVGMVPTVTEVRAVRRIDEHLRSRNPARVETLYREMVDMATQALERQRKDALTPPDLSVLGELVSAYGAMLEAAGRRDEAQSRFNQSLALARDCHDDFYTMWFSNELAKLKRAQGDYAEAGRLFEECARLGAEVRKDRRELGERWTSAMLCEAGDCLVAQNKPRDAEELYRQAVELNHKWHVVNAQNKLSDLLRKRGANDEIVPGWRAAVDATRQVVVAEIAANPTGKIEADAFAMAVVNLANNLRDRQQFDEAQAVYREALPVLRKHKDPYFAMWIARDWANLRRDQNQLDEAEEVFQQANELADDFARVNPIFAADWKGSIVSEWSDCLAKKGKTAEAEAMLRKSLQDTRVALERQRDQPNPPRLLSVGGFANTVWWLGRLLRAAERNDDAEQLFRDSLDLIRDSHDGYFIQRLVDDWMDLLVKQDAIDRAIELRHSMTVKDAEVHDFSNWLASWFSEYDFMKEHGADNATLLAVAEQAGPVLADARARLGDNHLDVAHILVNYGDRLSVLGEGKRGEPLLREGLEMRRKLLPDDDWRIGSGEALLGECLVGLEKYNEAEPLLLSGHGRLVKSDGADGPRTQRAARSLVRLYEATNRPDKVAEFGQLLPPAKR